MPRRQIAAEDIIDEKYLIVYVFLKLLCVCSALNIWLSTLPDNDGFLCCGTLSILTFSSFCCTIPYYSMNNLPIIFFATDPQSIDTADHPYTSLLISSSDPSSTPTNLTSKQKKLLHAHQKLGHLNFDAVQHIAQSGVLGSSFQSIGNCVIPLCHACIHGKQN